MMSKIYLLKYKFTDQRSDKNLHNFLELAHCFKTHFINIIVRRSTVFLNSVTYTVPSYCMINDIQHS